MKALSSFMGVIVGLSGMAAMSPAAEIVLSIERTTMPVDEWNQLKENFAQYEVLLESYGGGDGYSVRVTDNSVEFVYAYDAGWDYLFYATWKNDVIDQINALYAETGIGFKWAIEAIGEISPESNPWNDVDWLTDVEVVNGSYLKTGSIGWLYAEDWDPAGQFWAYSWESAFQGWLYVLGNGYYYNWQTAEWLLNLAGTGWFFVFESDGQGGTTGNGAWAALVAQPLPRLELVDEIVRSEMILQELPGLAVGVFQNGEIVHAAGYGYEDLDDPNSAITTGTIIRWASISKPLTAVAAFQMDEAANNYSVTDLVTEHVPYWFFAPDVDDTFTTVNHLLTNRSGIHQYGFGVADTFQYPYNGGKSPRHEAVDYVPEPDQFNARSAVSIFQGSGVDFFPPGSNFLYSTFGFNLLGATIDEASPNGYVAWVKDNIADPLGMSSLAVSTGSRSGYVRGCDGALSLLELGSVEWKLPGGGWESNIVDLLKFARGIAQGSLLNITSRLWFTAGANTWNYNFGIQSMGSGVNLAVYHGGSHPNVKTHMIAYPNQDYGLAVMIPADHGDVWRISDRIRTAMGVASVGVSLSPVDDCEISDTASVNCGYAYAGAWRDTGEDVVIRRGYAHGAWLRMWELMREGGYYCDDFEVEWENGERVWSGIFREGTGPNGMWRGLTDTGFRQKIDEMAAIGQRPVDVEVDLHPETGERRLSGLFRPGSGEVELVDNVTTGELATRREELGARGLEIIDVEGYLVNGELRWTGLFVEGGDTALYRNYTTTDFANLRQNLSSQGWRLIDIEAYQTSNGLRWAGVWDNQGVGAVEFFYDRDYCSFIDDHNRESAAGFQLMDMVRYIPED